MAAGVNTQVLPAVTACTKAFLKSKGPANRSDARAPSRSHAQARRAHPARRQQPVLLGAAGGPADPASPPAGSAPRRTAAGRAPTGRSFARQHAAAARWRFRLAELDTPAPPALQAMALAVELDALSEDLDAAMIAELRRSAPPGTSYR